jgi:hypothetical protein
VLRASAIVVTDASNRYAKQLLAHLGHKVTRAPLAGQPEPAGQLLFSYGVGTVVPQEGRLVLGAAAADAEALAHVEDVLARHLMKFGARRELVVSWMAAEDDEDDVGAAGDSPSKNGI